MINSELLLHNAEEKLRREMKSEDPTKPETMIQGKVAEALIICCRQDKRIAESIMNDKRGFAECCKSILRDTKNSRYISDESAYSRAVKFYMPEATLEFQMKVTSKGIPRVISFTDLLEE